MSSTRMALAKLEPLLRHIETSEAPVPCSAILPYVLRGLKAMAKLLSASQVDARLVYGEAAGLARMVVDDVELRESALGDQIFDLLNLVFKLYSKDGAPPRQTRRRRATNPSRRPNE